MPEAQLIINQPKLLESTFISIMMYPDFWLSSVEDSRFYFQFNHDVS